eukprot:CAMPEP_0172071870 /NCGR_PEP_ID=MMETSP1043-20130122/14022_1 /TAXON_ID=464988 /ORGANISM="Hemiselmis andersenii, Strain CCMP441" /LENGTH=74 /DNA_ID=CAMNT_0012732319 /DNA_START=358 /DNA_END=582 /DNA_ORIENTATION=-
MVVRRERRGVREAKRAVAEGSCDKTPFKTFNACSTAISSSPLVTPSPTPRVSDHSDISQTQTPALALAAPHPFG